MAAAKATIYLTLDTGRFEREARQVALDALVAAEVERVREQHDPALLALRAGQPVEHWGESDAAVLAYLRDRFPAGGWSANGLHSYPYSEYAQALMTEGLGIPREVEEQADCPRCGKTHPRLWRVRRALAGTLGNFPLFRINGREEVVDASLPTIVSPRLPRDAEEVAGDAFAACWHGTGYRFGPEGGAPCSK